MESLGIDIKLLIAQLINFGLFLFIFKKYIAKPFSDFLNLEIKKEKEKERILSELAKKQELVEKEAGRAKEKMKKEYDVAIQQARQEALVLRNQLVAAAKKEADDIIEKSKRQISEERSRLNTEMKEKTIDLSVVIVNKVLEKFLTPEVQSQITKEIVRNYKEKKE